MAGGFPFQERDAGKGMTLSRVVRSLDAALRFCTIKRQSGVRVDLSDYDAEASRILEAEFACRDIGYKELACSVPDESFIQLKTKNIGGTYSAIAASRTARRSFERCHTDRMADDAARCDAEVPRQQMIGSGCFEVAPLTS